MKESEEHIQNEFDYDNLNESDYEKEEAIKAMNICDVETLEDDKLNNE